MNRRDFLRSAGRAALGLTATGAILAARAGHTAASAGSAVGPAAAAKADELPNIVIKAVEAHKATITPVPSQLEIPLKGK